MPCHHAVCGDIAVYLNYVGSLADTCCRKSSPEYHVDLYVLSYVWGLQYMSAIFSCSRDFGILCMLLGCVALSKSNVVCMGRESQVWGLITQSRCGVLSVAVPSLITGPDTGQGHSSRS